MRREVVLDIETRNTFQDVGAYNPMLLQVSLVGVYFYETDSFESFLEEDFPKLWPRLERADKIIGYNLLSFDYPCLQSYYLGDIKKFPTIDLLADIEKNLGFRIKLDDVAHATLGIGKSGDGLQAVAFWKNGEIDKLRDYCLQDVRITRDVYEFALKHSHVKYIDKFGREQTIPLPMAPHTDILKTAMNLTLGL